MEDKTQLSEHILITLEIKARQTGKPLKEVIEHHKKSLEIQEKAIEIINLISEMTGENTDDIIKEACTMAGLKIPTYQTIKAPYSYKRIKENDTLIFNTSYTKLDDSDIYLFNFSVLDDNYLLYGEYKKELDSFTTGILDIDLKNCENIKILGVLTKVEREIDI